MTYNKILKLFFVNFSILFFSLNLGAQSIITLDQPESGAIDNVAQNKVRLRPGYQYTPTAGDKMHAYIDEASVGNILYTNLHNNSTFGNKVIDTNLPVGMTEGIHGVSPTGASTYLIPIPLPAGTANMQPELSFAYNSHANNGNLGLGWNITGLSVISRASKTIHHNGAIQPVMMNNSDDFALDGNRLVEVSTDTYHTEEETFSRITTHNLSGGGIWFKVETKSGLTMEYGKTTDSRLTEDGGTTALIWHLNKVYDNYGNYMLYSYTNTERQTRIKEITYTGNSTTGLSPYNKIKFYYEKRSDTNTIYVAGESISIDYLLTNVKISTEDEVVVKEYGLHYGSDGIHSYLKEIREYGADGCSNLNETAFLYNDLKLSVSQQTISNVETETTDILTGDFNGDGLTDMLSSEWKTLSNGGKFNTEMTVHLNNGISFDAGTPLTIPCSGITLGGQIWQINDYDKSKNFLVSDLDGDGRDDILLFELEKIGSSYHLLETKVYSVSNNGDLTINGTYSPPSSHSIINFLSGVFLIPGDFDGDGRLDYMASLSNGTLHESFLSFPGKNDLNNQVSNMPSWSNSDKQFAIDFDGDGKSEVLILQNGTTSIYEITESNNSYSATQVFQTSAYSADDAFLLGDFNGDNKTDILRRFNTDKFEKLISTGEGFISEPFSLNHAYATTFHRVSIGDYNGDGKSDILHSYPDPNSTTNQDLYLDTYYSTGNSFFHDQEIEPFTSQAPNTGRHLEGDYNGDGNTDIIIRRLVGTGSFPSILKLEFNEFDRNRLLEKVKNGYNQETEFMYLSLTSQLNYSSSQSASYPFVHHALPFYVVHEVKNPDGIGGVYSMNYDYEDLRIYSYGKGLLGFSKITIEDPIAELKTVTENEFNTQFGAIAVKKQEVRMTTDNSLVSSSTYTNEFQGFNNNKRYFRKVTFNSSYDYVNDFSTIVSYTYDDYGNLTYSATNVDDALEITAVQNSNYIQNGTWIPSLAETSTTTKIRGGEPSYSVESTRTFNLQGKLTSITDFADKTEPITTTYSNFDSFGQPTTTTISASGMTPRTTSIGYDSKGRFITTKTNQLNQQSTITYDPKWGKPTSVTSVDGLTNTFKYDAYGRLEEATSPLGHTTKTTWTWDVQTGTGSSATMVENAVYYMDVTTPESPNTRSVYDRFNRERLTQTEGYDGTQINIITSYDSKGRLKTQSLPFYNGNTVIYNTYTYDLYDRITQTTPSTGINPTAYLYSSNSGETTVTVTAPDGKVNSQKTDATGKVIQAVDYTNSVLSYSYTSFGSPRAIESGGTTLTSMVFDEYGQQTQLIDQNAGITLYDYNAFGEIDWQEDANGNVTTTTYDDFGRVDFRVLPEGTINYEYVSSGNGLNKVEKITNFNGVVEDFTYDVYNRMIEKSTIIDGTTNICTYAYDDYGRKEIITYPSGFGIRKQYNSRGYLSAVTNSDNTTTIFQTSKVNAFEQYTQYTLGNGLVSDMTYDEFGFPEKFKAGNIQDIDFDFNIQNGNLNYRQDNKAGASNNIIRHESFLYDATHRLESSTVTGQVAKAVTYHDNGNIETKADIGTYSYTSNKINAVIEIDNPNGEISTLNQSISFNSFHQPTSISEGLNQLNVTYGANLNRIKTQLVENGTTLQTRYFFGEYEKQVTNSSTQHVHYITCGDGLNAIIVRENGNDSYFYTYKDYLGSLLVLTDATGNVVAKQNFDAWGRNRNTADWTYNNVQSVPNWLYRGFTGHEHLPEFDLVNMNGRLYDSKVGRMLSVDNFVSDPFSLQSYDRYGYALNNPLKYTDPTGEELVSLTVLAIAAGGGALLNVGFQAYQGNIKSPKDFFVAAGIGAVGGAVGAVAGAAALVGAGGTAALSTFGAGFVAGGAGGAAGGFIEGVGNAAYFQNANLGEAFGAGIQGAVFGGISGGLIGGASNVIAKWWRGRKSGNGPANMDNTRNGPTNSTKDLYGSNVSGGGNGQYNGEYVIRNGKQVFGFYDDAGNFVESSVSITFRDDLVVTAPRKACFVAGTVVLTENGETNIEDIRLDSLVVWSYNDNNRITGLGNVINGFVKSIDLQEGKALKVKLSEKNESISFQPMNVFTEPDVLLDVWGSEVMPLEFYNKKEIYIQKYINEKEPRIITYAPIGNEREWLDIDYEEITPYTWKWVELELKNSDSTLSKVSLRRPNWWIKQNGADKTGNQVKLSLPELGIDGKATVTKIYPSQLDTRFWDYNRNDDYISQPITGRFEHKSDDVWNYYFQGLDKPIGASSTHPFWSEDRQDWVAVGELKIGEIVKTREGVAQFISKEKVKGLQTVYNFEIYREHNYLITENAFLVHNNCGNGWIKKDLYSRLGRRNSRLRKAFEDAMDRGVARRNGEAGIKRLTGRGKRFDGKWYQYELKTPPGSEFGNHRLYGNLQNWTNPRGVTEQRVIFEIYRSSH